ncbi:unnamed protein product [Thlaspi arvense]|uniref:Late embryogenesis abundant protein LEA-2 subgroup domain-containing protein n=1 Tax=Thlaspi arvense TaxID=13288 RepID=A0AAU9RTT1_THLAR|nr:unnamed protein product [Thlaspi arvense]
MDATVFAFNVSNPPNFISTNLQITISSRNPNDRIGIYYDKLDVYATYCGQQITPPTPLPSAYQGHKDVNSWCPFVCGNWVPVAPYLAVTLAQDQVAGTGLLNIKVDGRMRWRVGSFISGSHHLHVNCPAYISFGNTNSGISVGPAVKYQLAQSCHVDV